MNIQLPKMTKTFDKIFLLPLTTKKKKQIKVGLEEWEMRKKEVRKWEMRKCVHILTTWFTISHQHTQPAGRKLMWLAFQADKFTIIAGIFISEVIE